MTRPRPAACAALLTMLLTACSPVTILNLLAPRQGVAVSSDLAYGDGPRRRLDVYAPSPSRPGAPVVVFFYGGNWDSGARAMYRFVGAALAAKGVVAVIPDYRIFPEVRFPSFVEDAAAAVAWTRAHAAEYGGDPHRLFVMGHSAGAQIGALLALDPHYLAAQGLAPRDLAGFVGLAGPYDFLPLTSARLKQIFAPEDEWPGSQPIAYVAPGAPPILLAAPADDVTVDPGNTARLAARLRTAGDPVTEIVYPGIGHKELIGAFAGSLSFLAPVLRDTLNFVGAGAPSG